MSLCGIKLEMSSSRHPQTDGSSEIMNRMVENYLRCYCSYHQKDWDELLASAEFAHNSAVSDEFGTSPFEVDLGWNPSWTVLTSSESAIETLAEFKCRLKISLDDAKYAYQVSKARTSLNHKPHSYKVGDKLWIKKCLFEDAYAKSQKSDKLSAKRFGTFHVKKLIGKNAVKLELPSHLKIHDVIHVIHTTPFFEQPPEISAPVPPRPDLVPAVEREEYIIDRILQRRKRGRGYQFLTLMKGSPAHDAEWQPTADFVDRDGTMTEPFAKYIKENKLLPHLYAGDED